MPISGSNIGLSIAAGEGAGRLDPYGASNFIVEIEGLYAGDLAYLQDLYQRVNEHGHDRVVAQCPHCEKTFNVEVRRAGGSGATP